MAGTEGLSPGVGRGGHKGLLLQRWSGITCPALHPGAPLSHVWSGEERLRCSFRDKRGLFVGAQQPPEPGYKVTHTHCSAGNSQCKQTGVSCQALVCKLWLGLLETGLTAHFHPSTAMLVSSTGPDVKISLHQIKDVCFHPLLMLISLVDLRNVNHSCSFIMFLFCPFTFQSSSDITDIQLQTF